MGRDIVPVLHTANTASAISTVLEHVGITLILGVCLNWSL